MAYKIIVSLRAQNEIEEAIDYYAKENKKIPLKFIQAVKRTYSALQKNPHFEIRYKNVRSLKLYRFPYSLFYIVKEDGNVVKILSYFHNKKNPNKMPNT